MFTIKNKQLEAVISDNPLELTSLTWKNKQYTYQLDGDWQKQNPICFPITGRAINNEYVYNGKKYPMPLHGFFRDIKTWKVIKKSETQIVFEFVHHNEFSEFYPFEFSLQVSYEAKNDQFINEVTIFNHEKSKVLPYCFGWHPSFVIDPDSAKITFANAQVLTSVPLDNFFKADMTTTDIKEFIPSQMDYSKGQSYDVLNHTLNHLTLSDKDREIRIGVKDYQNIVFWKINDAAKFICIEPWDGHQDYEDSGATEIMEKPWVQKITANNKKTYALDIKFIK